MTTKKLNKRKYKRKKTTKKVEVVTKDQDKPIGKLTVVEDILPDSMELGKALIEAAKEVIKDVAEMKPKKRVRPKRNIIGSKKTVTSFKAWFINTLDKDSRIKAHHFSQLLIYMKGMGIRERDTVARFEAGLKAFYGE